MIDNDPFDPEQQRSDAAVTAHVEKTHAEQVHAETERRINAYHRVFFRGSPEPEDRKIVMDDISWFCFGDRSAFHENERLHALMSGRQEFWLRLMDHLKLTPDQMILKYGIKPGG